MRCTLSGLKRNNMCSRTCYKADAMFGARAVGEKLTTAARLAGRAVCVIGSEDPFPGSGRLGKVDRCIARVVCNIALDRKAGPVTFGLHAKEGICPGGQMWCGLAAASPMLKFFLSTGTPEFMGGAAEHLKPTPEAAERFLMAPGRITLPGRYLSLAGHDVVEDDAEVLSLVLFGTAESMRNLSGLVHYVSDDIFTAVLMPGGASCASMITYAAGMAERAANNAAYIGPVDPTGNAWLPGDLMSMALPMPLARKMAENVDRSFLGKRSGVAFPEKRLEGNERR